MCERKIALDESVQARGRLDFLQPPSDARRIIGEHLAHCLRDEVILAGKMRVEPAMRQAGAAHDVGNTHAIHTLLAHLRCGRTQQARTCLGLVVRAVAHGLALS